MRVGDKQGRRPYLTPDNKGMSKRANDRLESLVTSANARTQAALRVDGVPTLVWNRTLKGSVLCSCSRAADGPNSDPNDFASYTILGNASGGKSAEGRSAIPPTNKKVVNTSKNLFTTDDDLDFVLKGDSTFESQGKKRADIDNSFDFSDITGPDARYESDASDPNALMAAQFSKDHLVGETVKCPVCAGTSFVDSWSVRGGKRLVMSFLETDTFTTDGLVDTSTRPYTLTLQPGQTLDWSMRLPKYFVAVHSARLWQSFIPVYDPIRLGNGNPMTLKTLTALSGNSYTQEVTFAFTAQTKVVLTHFDIVLSLADPSYIQFPQVDVPYAKEFYDYNTNIAVEAGAEIEAYPGDLLCDFKYRRMWRITSVNRKQTGENRTLSQTLDCRLVSVIEPFSILSPFDHVRDVGEKAYRLALEKWQSGSR